MDVSPNTLPGSEMTTSAELLTRPVLLRPTFLRLPRPGRDSGSTLQAASTDTDLQ